LADETPSYSLREFQASDGYRHHYRHYPAAGSPRAELVCIHGIQSHAGWYEHSCRRYAEGGYSVSFFDRRGSGLNHEQRGDAPGFRRLVDDVAEFILSLGNKTVYLLAISWGGKIAVALQKRHPGLIRGLVLICPGFFAQVRPPLGQRLAIVWSRLVSPTRVFPVPLNDPELFTANPRWLQFLRDDPLSLRQATARLLLESVRLDFYLRSAPRFVQVPVLTLLAGQERIIRNDRTRLFVNRFAGTDQTILEYPEAHHTLEFEPDPDPIINDILAWLEKLQSTEKQT
jgi:alpha-beta hydrolase superfamily lysophospholipase